MKKWSNKQVAIWFIGVIIFSLIGTIYHFPILFAFIFGMIWTALIIII